MDSKDKEKEHEQTASGRNPDVNDVEEEEEDEEGNKRAVVLGPQVPLKEQLELDKVRNIIHCIPPLLLI
jgi:Rho GDP-dissociation inhibitor